MTTKSNNSARISRNLKTNLGLGSERRVKSTLVEPADKISLLLKAIIRNGVLTEKSRLSNQLSLLNKVQQKHL